MNSTVEQEGTREGSEFEAYL